MTLEFPSPDVDMQEQATAFQGYFRIERYRFRHRAFDGGWTQPMTREVFERGHAAAVLLYDPVLERFVMGQQFRIGAHAAGWNPWLLELVAGIIEPGETAEQVAIRESEEEAGRQVLDLWPIDHYLVSPGGTSETAKLFLGRVSAEGEGRILQISITLAAARACI